MPYSPSILTVWSENLEGIRPLHNHLIGKICKLTDFGLVLANEYQAMFGIGNFVTARMLHWSMQQPGNKVMLMFNKERPFNRLGTTWYCFTEVGEEGNGDYHWFTLDQVVVCK